jgi:hypothetical protein
MIHGRDSYREMKDRLYNHRKDIVEHSREGFKKYYSAPPAADKERVDRMEIKNAADRLGMMKNDINYKKLLRNEKSYQRLNFH